jgi:hypothetical protein
MAKAPTRSGDQPKASAKTIDKAMKPANLQFKTVNIKPLAKPVVKRGK